MLHSFFYKLVSSSDFVYRSDNYFREPVNRTIDRPISSRLVYHSLKRTRKEQKKKSEFVNTEKTEFEAEYRKLEN